MRTEKNNLNRKRRGLNLIEIAIVLAVIGLVIGGIYVAASSVYANLRKQAAQEQVLGMVQNIRAALSSSGSATGLNNQIAIQLGAVPSDMISGTSIVNPWQGAVTLSSASSSTFAINYAAVPYDACGDFIMKTAGIPALASGLTQVVINGGSAVTTANITLANITTGCGTSGSVPIIFTFNVRN